MIKAVVFDLDDTLYPEIDYVKSGFAAVESYVKKNFELNDCQNELMRLFIESKIGVFDRFVNEKQMNVEVVRQFIEIYRNHIPNIILTDEVKDTLVNLRKKGYALGIITDGRPEGQRAKISALGLNTLVDRIIITDELGGSEYRKPNPKAFELMCIEFGLAPEQMLYVGDNPQKDFAVKEYLPISTVRYSNGGTIYDGKPYLKNIFPDHTITSISELLMVV